MRWLLITLLLLSPAAAQETVTDTIRFGKDKRSVPLTVLTPPGYTRGKTPPVVITLPPGPGTADMVTVNLRNYWATEGMRRGYIVVAPEIFGRSLDTEAGAFVDAVFAWMDGRLTYDRRRVALIGQSNGGIGALFSAVARPNRFSGVLVLPGQFLGKPAELGALRGKSVWMLVGADDDPDRWLEPVKATAAALQTSGAKVRLDVLEGQGHVPALDPRALYNWIDAL